MDVHRKEAHAFRVHLASLAFFAVLTPLLFWKIIFTSEDKPIIKPASQH